MPPLRLVVLSDTHNLTDDLVVPPGDVLVHAGDLTKRGTLRQLEHAASFLRSLPHAHKVVIAGNHDFCLQDDARRARSLLDGLTYLEDAATEIEGMRFWGSPWQPWFYDWAFNLQRGAPLREVWARIPEGTDVLVTHGPPHGILDRTADGDDVGCEELTARVAGLRPSLHCFGHIHEAYGTLRRDATLFVNASTCTRAYVPTNPPIVLDRDADAWRLVT